MDRSNTQIEPRIANGDHTMSGPSIPISLTKRKFPSEANGWTPVKKNVYTHLSSKPEEPNTDQSVPITKGPGDDTHFENLLILLEHRCRTHPDKSLVFYSLGQLESPPLCLSYPAFLRSVKDVATQLLQEDIKPGSIVLLHLDNHHDNLLYWWAVTYAGFIPAMSTPLSNNVDQRRAHLLHLWKLLEDPFVLTHQKLLRDFAVQSALRVHPIESLQHPRSDDDHPVEQAISRTPSDLAALMLTSGSTGLCKAVCLTHGQILKSISGKSTALGTDRSMTFFSFIAADHVACMTEIHGQAIWAGAEQVYAEAADIVTDPLSFWKLCHKHQITHTFAPNFFLAALGRALTTPDGLEMQVAMSRLSLRSIVSGGEANVVETGLALSKILQDAGAPANCLKPAFGMTETSAGSIYSQVFPGHDVAQGYNFACVGQPIVGLEMRVVDDDGCEIPPGHSTIGNLQVRGDVVFSDYYNDPESTAKSFDNGWFNTGDQAMVDVGGQLSLTGRVKELLIVNGVNYSPSSVEAILENIEGTVPSFTLVLPYRAPKADTESLAVVYLPDYDPFDAETRERTNNDISTAVLLQIGVRPWIIPLDATILQKSTLGKLPRNKIRQALEAGSLDSYDRLNQEEVAAYQMAQYEAPANDVEQLIIDCFLEVLDLQGLKLGATTSLLSVGINSIAIIAIKQKLQLRLGCGNIPIAAIISSPTPRELARNIPTPSEAKREYNPIVTLQAHGDKAPLWLIHPGVGEVLVFLPLAYHLRDRPVYAMRARGFEPGEPYFASTEDAVQTYYDHIRQTQPHGPYALAGYSFGSMIAFELAKRLRQTDEVRFLGSFNLPPHIKTRMRQLDWYSCLMHLCYFLNFFSEQYAHKMYPVLRKGTHDAALEHVLEVAPPERLIQLDIDTATLNNWVNLAHTLQSSARDYDPTGTVDCMDVFYAVPLAEAAKDMDDWLDNYLSKWENFCVQPPRFHRVDGAHYTMINPTNVHTFQKVLNKALKERGV